MKAARTAERSLVSIIVWCFLLNGCSSWRVLETTPAARYYEHARLVLKDGSVVEIKLGKARGDTLFAMGRIEGNCTTSFSPCPWEPFSVAVEDIQEIETRQASPSRTILLVGILLVPVLAGGVAAVVIIGNAPGF